MTDYKWIAFQKLTTRTKTSKWEVYSKDGQQLLGTVSWWAHWRQYAFFPKANTIFERQCLRDIANFCESMTTEYRNQKKQ